MQVDANVEDVVASVALAEAVFAVTAVTAKVFTSWVTIIEEFHQQ